MNIPFTHTGEVAALLVAVFWTITALAFESASRKVGSLAVNLIRLVIGFSFLTLFTWIYRGNALPTDATPQEWFWLSLSGLIGFVLGDLCLFKSYTIIGSRLAMLIMTLVPPITAFLGWAILGEKMTLFNLAGMLVTVSGIFLAVLSRSQPGEKLKLNLPMKGLLLALGGAVGQASGLVISKLGMGNYDPFAATQIRVITGIAGFSLLVLLMSRGIQVKKAVLHPTGMRGIVIGSFFGPFLGVSFSLLSVQFTETGVASTIMALVPIFIIAPTVLLFKQKISLREIIAAIISVAGVALFFID